MGIKSVEKQEDAYIIEVLRKACARYTRYGAVINEVSYLAYDPKATHGIDFLLYLDSHKVLPKYQIERDIKSATNSKGVKLVVGSSEILATAITPQIIPPEIYSEFSLELPFISTVTHLEIPFKCNIIGIEEGDMSLSIFLKDRGYDKSDEIPRKWERLLVHRLGLKEL